MTPAEISQLVTVVVEVLERVKERREKWKAESDDTLSQRDKDIISIVKNDAPEWAITKATRITQCVNYEATPEEINKLWALIDSKFQEPKQDDAVKLLWRVYRAYTDSGGIVVTDHGTMNERLEFAKAMTDIADHFRSILGDDK